jgi:uncharacterized phage-associated protein
MKKDNAIDVFDVAKWFIKYNYDTPRNTLDGNMKLQKLLYFAQLIHLAKFDEVLFNEPILAFENGCVIEKVRVAYKNDHHSFISQANSYTENFNQKQNETLLITAEIFGKSKPEELSELNHFDFSWKEAYDRSKGFSGFRYREDSIVSVDVIRKNDLIRINKMLDAFELAQNYKQDRIIINGVTFYYDPQKIKMTEEVMSRLKEFPTDESEYSVCLDESVGLVIY